MLDKSDHGAQVDAWLERAAGDPSSERLIDAFDQAFTVLWKRAHTTLGEVTLTAILDRVLYSAAERFPLLAPLETIETGLRSDTFRARAADLEREQLAEAIRFILLEFLTVLGNLTAEVLSPALHAELARTFPGAAPSGEKAKS